MAWNQPETFVTGSIVTREKMDQLVYENMRYLKGLDTGGEGVVFEAPIVLINLTTTQRNALSERTGMHIYNTTNRRVEYYNGSSWVTYSQQAVNVTVQGGAAPSGTIAPFGGSTIPTGWLECNGQAVSRSTYAALFTVLGTTHGRGNGSSTFNLPDYRGKTIIGADANNGVGASVGDNEKAVPVAYHNHTISVIPSSQGGTRVEVLGGFARDTGTTANALSRTAGNSNSRLDVRQASLATKFMMKT